MTLGDISKCGTLGGDVEMMPPLKKLAERHPDDVFIIMGRSNGDLTGLPPNVVDFWTQSRRDTLRNEVAKIRGTTAKGGLTIEQHVKVRDLFRALMESTWGGLDNMIIWAGQHGTTNSPIPKVADRHVLTKPHDWSAYYAGFLIDGINHWRSVDPVNREEVWLNADPRNYLKCRDLQWPLHHPVLAQFKGEHNMKHYRWGAGWAKEWNPHFNVHTSDKEYGIVESLVRTTYSRLEINGLAPGTPFGNLVRFNGDWADRKHFGLFINEARKEVNPSKSRLTAMKNWVEPLNPAWVHGKWSQESQDELGRTIDPAPWDMYFPSLHSVRCTFTTPSSGSGWATTKPWEAFAAGTVCFFHPEYDVQNNILGDAPAYLGDWLRVKTPAELKMKVDYLNDVRGRRDWEYITGEQHRHFRNAMERLDYLADIEKRIYG
jgi:hypothetical protein